VELGEQVLNVMGVELAQDELAQQRLEVEPGVLLVLQEGVGRR
jgi:hypothetical protein